MPRYEFLCEKCKKPFELIMTISERDKAQVKCPTCKGTNVVPQFGGVHGADGEEELTVCSRSCLEAGDPGNSPKGRRSTR
jgi:putative FmdB family regulatory protein